ncbi:MAG: glycogen debranching protein [Kamptonema sp. SIO4C4]|nr:glycogen debranching protein [Kamptonema sp. SIO4C4]
MKIEFGRDICNNLATAETREWLLTNGIGGYAAGTISGLLTRRYHSLLMAALDPPLGRTLLLAKLDEDCHYQNRPYPLYGNRWADGTIAPQGYLHIERFYLNKGVVTWLYAFADVLLEKSIWMQQGENTTYIHYRLRRGKHPLTLAIKALVNYRDSHQNTWGDHWRMAIHPQPKGIQVQAFPDAVPFGLSCVRGQSKRYSPQPQWHIYPQWYYQFDLPREQYRGLPDRDDHLHAATVETKLRRGESLTLVASTQSTPNLEIPQVYEQRRNYSQQLIQWGTQAAPPSLSRLPDWIKSLLLAADQFIVDRTLPDDPEGKSIIAGYPWFGDWGRDTMISLPGLTLTTGRFDIARKILRTYSFYLDQGMLPNLFPDGTHEPAYNTVDAILWYFEALRAYWEATQDDALIVELFPKLAEVIDWHIRGTRYNIKLDPQDGLLQAGTPGEQLTWMDAKVEDWVVTPRNGKPIEVNALWYNALVLMAHWGRKFGRSYQRYEDQAAQTLRGFSRFWNPEKGYCFDVLDTPQGNDALLRPNQIFAVSLPVVTAAYGGMPLLMPQEQQKVVDIVARHLLTSHGLRSLAPYEENYIGIYGGDRIQRDGAYHQGTVWGWLIGHFIQAHWQVYHDLSQAKSFLDPMRDHLQSGCVGNLSEIFDGNAPHTPRGAFAQAWTVAEVLRIWFFLAKNN